MWGFVFTARHCLQPQPAAKSAWSSFSKSSLEHSRGCCWWGNCFLFSTLHEENFSHLCKWASLRLRRSVRWGREKPSTKSTLTCFLPAPYTVPSDEHGDVHPWCKRQWACQKSHVCIFCRAWWPAEEGGPGHVIVFGRAGRGSRNVSDACLGDSWQWGL